MMLSNGRFSDNLALNCIKPSPAPHLLMFHHISPVLKRWIEMLLRVRFSRFDRTNSIIFTTHNKTEKNLPMIDWKDLACTTPPFLSLSLSLSLSHTHSLSHSCTHSLAHPTLKRRSKCFVTDSSPRKLNKCCETDGMG